MTTIRSARRTSQCALHFLAACSIAVLALTDGIASGLGGLSRESGALYVEDYFPEAVELEVLKAAPIFSQLDGRRRLGTLNAGQRVKLVAISDKAYRVRGQAGSRGVSGWVGITFLKEPVPDFRENVKAFHERQSVVEDLIAKKQVALGMTPDEVVASLGAPDERTSSVEASNVKESLSYVTYDRVPQRVPRRDIYGQVYYASVYVKVETGRRTLHFENGAVVKIDETERDPRAGRLKIVPTPVVVFR